jgi:hypothetical protein
MPCKQWPGSHGPFHSDHPIVVGAGSCLVLYASWEVGRHARYGLVHHSNNLVIGSSKIRMGQREIRIVESLMVYAMAGTRTMMGALHSCRPPGLYLPGPFSPREMMGIECQQSRSSATLPVSVARYFSPSQIITWRFGQGRVVPARGVEKVLLEAIAKAAASSWNSVRKRPRPLNKHARVVICHHCHE